MPDDPTPSPAAEAQAGAAVATAPQSAPAAPSFNHREAWSLSKAFEGSAIPVGEDEGAVAVSNGSVDQPTPAEAKAPDDKPAPSTPDEGVKASDTPAPDSEPDPETPSRRQEIAAKKDARIAELEAQVKATDPATLRETLRAEILAEAGQAQSAEKIRADAERFEQSCRMADTDTRLGELVPGTDPPQTLYDWRETQKALRDSQPEAERAIRADADRRVTQVTEAERARSEREIAQGWDRIKADMGTQIEASSKLPGVDPAAFKAKGANWQTMAEQIHAAGAAWKEAELAARVEKAETEAATLRQQLKDAGAEEFGLRRAPAVVGRSAGAAPNGKVFDPSAGYRGNLAAAFGWETNGTG